MNKSTALLSRRTDLSREYFQDYYETRHAPLAISHFPFTKYVRNHLLSLPDIGFDTVSEFWSGDYATIAEVLGSAVGDMMREDERRFMDQSMIRSSLCTEFLIHGPARQVERTPRSRLALLLGRGDDLGDDLFIEHLKEYGRTLATEAGEQVSRVTLDVFQTFLGMTFPYTAILWLWLKDEEQPPSVAIPSAGIDVQGVVLTRSCETPPEVMADARRKQSEGCL
jgi:hypothetical protein